MWEGFRTERRVLMLKKGESGVVGLSVTALLGRVVRMTPGTAASVERLNLVGESLCGEVKSVT